MKNRVITLSKKEESSSSEQYSVHANSLESQTKEKNTNSNLVIEDNTIYEIDEECLNCLKKEKNMN